MKRIGIALVSMFLGLAAGCGKEEPAQAPPPEKPAEPAAPPKAAPPKPKPVEKRAPTLDLAAYPKQPVVELQTSLGLIVLELDAEKAPKTVQTILAYVEDGFYDGTVFHRIMPEFVIQGGGKTADAGGKLVTKPYYYETIPSEAGNGLSHVRGAVALARATDPNSGSCQFYITLKDKPGMDGITQGKLVRSKAYTVFGKVIEGMDVVDAMAALEIADKVAGTPVKAPVITKARVRKN